MFAEGFVCGILWTISFGCKLGMLAVLVGAAAEQRKMKGDDGGIPSRNSDAIPGARG